jgi:hypothetical protein
LESLRFVVAVALGGTVAGCGLIDPNIADFDLSLPPKEFTVDTEQFKLQVEGDTFPAVDCSASAGICTAAAMGVCADEGMAGDVSTQCFGHCNAQLECEATVLIQLFAEVDLAAERPELAEIDDQPIVDVSIGAVWFDVLENTMNVDSPAMTVYVAPDTVRSTGSPQALAVGTFPSVPTGTTIDDGMLELHAEGNARLRSVLESYKTPFNVLVGASVEVVPGDPVPRGRLRAEFNVRATAGF